MQNKILKFNLEEWVQFASLFERGYTLQHALQLMNQDYDNVLLSMQNATSIESIILASAKGRFKTHLSFFINLTLLYDAIYSSAIMVMFERDIKQNIRKKTAYPLFIFLFSFVTIFLFSNYIVPQLLTSFDAKEDMFLFNLLLIVKTISLLLLFSIILLLLIYLLLKTNKHLSTIFYNRFSYRIPICRDYISYYLSGYLKTLHERGFSSKESFQFMINLKTNDYLCKTTIRINNDLKKGVDLMSSIQSNEYLSNKFKMNFLIGSSTGNLEKALEQFMQFQQEKWFQLIKKISIVIQCVSYGFVAILIICVYQIMLIPLQIIEKI